MTTPNQHHRIRRAQPRMYYSLLLLALLINPSQCFSTPINSNSAIRIKSIIIDHASTDSTSRTNNDATTIPIEKILSTDDDDADLTTVLFYASDFAPRQEMSASTYSSFTQARHIDCINLFDGYESNIIRCEALDQTSLNVRWKASWIPAGSTWLYDLADVAGWTVTRKSPDPAMISTFSWRAVFGMFQRAFATGDITLPISSVEGNTVISIVESTTMNSMTFSLRESIDLVSEADKSRLQNRRVAQELASWVDVSRRPPAETCDEWAGIVRERILTGVAGAGALDVDPNEDDAEGGIALVVFGVICLSAVALLLENLTLL